MICLSFDIIIKNGRIIDGTGNPWYKADVGISGDRVESIGDLSESSYGRIIDAEGLIVAPGFIDTHSHSDIVTLFDPRVESKIRQGVTTELVGNCGNSAAPINELVREMWEKRIKRRFGDDFVARARWETMAEYLDLVDAQGASYNFAALVGHGTVRANVMGQEDRAPTEAELEEMKGLVASAMQDGAFGLSTGLIYIPGAFAETEEIIELTKVVAEHDGLYFSHIRGEGETLLKSVEEAIRVGREAGVPVQIAHFKATGEPNWGKTVDSLRLVAEGRAKGVDVVFDQYPYIASSTGLSSRLPHWAQEGGSDVMLERLRDPATRKKIKDALTPNLNSIMIASAKNNTQYEGMRVTEIAEKEGKDSRDVVFDLLLAEEAQVQIVSFGLSEEDVRRVMRSPYGMVGSDGSAIAPHGILGEGKPHPRSYGTFARVIGHYVREGVLSLQEAVRKMTSAPALHLGLKDRGLLREGYKADITIFDPEKVKDEATFIDPHQFASGIPYVIVNGTVVIDEGEHTGELPGVVIRP